MQIHFWLSRPIDCSANLVMYTSPHLSLSVPGWICWLWHREVISWILKHNGVPHAHFTKQDGTQRSASVIRGWEQKGKAVVLVCTVWFRFNGKIWIQGIWMFYGLGLVFWVRETAMHIKRTVEKKCPTCPFYQDLCQNLMGSPWPQTILPPSCMNSFCVILLTDKPWKHGLHGKGNLVLCVLW